MMEEGLHIESAAQKACEQWQSRLARCWPSVRLHAEKFAALCALIRSRAPYTCDTVAVCLLACEALHHAAEAGRTDSMDDLISFTAARPAASEAEAASAALARACQSYLARDQDVADTRAFDWLQQLTHANDVSKVRPWLACCCLAFRCPHTGLTDALCTQVALSIDPAVATAPAAFALRHHLRCATSLRNAAADRAWSVSAPDDESSVVLTLWTPAGTFAFEKTLPSLPCPYSQRVASALVF